MWNSLPSLAALTKIEAGALLVLAGVLGGGGWYGYHTIASLNARVEALDTEITETKAALADATSTITAAFDHNVATIQEILEQFEDEVGDISGAVETLEKLTTTDPELLAKYSKVFFLSDNYAPARLSEIPKEYTYFEDRTMQLIPEVQPFLKRLMDRAKRDGVDLFVYSAFRSFDTQEAIKGQYTVTYGAGTANQFSADQGYSEHQLGTTVDFMTTGIGGSLDAFGTTKAYEWLTKNAYRYGFVLSYPQGNQYYIYEPWHWRFVGDELAGDLHDDDAYFYSLDQRTIDKYLPTLFD